MDFALIGENLARVREQIAAAQARAGIAEPVRIIAVTKGHPLAAVEAAARVGLEDVGENRVQEGVQKREAAAGLSLRWHLIGHLQTNKAKFVPGHFTMVHSVDSVRVAHALAAAHAKAAEPPEPIEVLVQVNVAGESQKAGCAPDETEAVATAVHEAPGLVLRGLMTMAPFVDDEAVQRAVFSGLRQIRDRLNDAGFTMPDLSMGMSGDFEAAVEEGATLVRLGTVLFGERSR